MDQGIDLGRRARPRPTLLACLQRYARATFSEICRKAEIGGSRLPFGLARAGEHSAKALAAAMNMPSRCGRGLDRDGTEADAGENVGIVGLVDLE